MTLTELTEPAELTHPVEPAELTHPVEPAELTEPAPTDRAPVDRAAQAGLRLHSSVWWPPQTRPPAVAGFIVSSFSPLVAEVAARCLAAAGPLDAELAERTAVVLVSAFGDVTAAVHVADAVDTGRRVGPLMFFQSVPNAVAGHIAAQAGLAGPVVCISAGPDPVGAALELAALLIMDGDADAALLVVAEQAEALAAGAADPGTADRGQADRGRDDPGTADPGQAGAGPADRALAMLVSRQQATEGERP